MKKNRTYYKSYDNIEKNNNLLGAYDICEIELRNDKVIKICLKYLP